MEIDLRDVNGFLTDYDPGSDDEWCLLEIKWKAEMLITVAEARSRAKEINFKIQSHEYDHLIRPEDLKYFHSIQVRENFTENRDPTDDYAKFCKFSIGFGPTSIAKSIEELDIFVDEIPRICALYADTEVVISVDKSDGITYSSDNHEFSFDVLKDSISEEEDIQPVIEAFPILADIISIADMIEPLKLQFGDYDPRDIFPNEYWNFPNDTELKKALRYISADHYISDIWPDYEYDFNEFSLNRSLIEKIARSADKSIWKRRIDEHLSYEERLQESRRAWCCCRFGCGKKTENHEFESLKDEDGLFVVELAEERLSFYMNGRESKRQCPGIWFD